MAFGATVTGAQTQNEVSSFAGQLYGLLEQFDGWVQRIMDNGGPTGATMQAAYAQVDGATEATTDCNNLAAFINAVGIVAQFAKAEGSNGLPLPANGQTVTDNTAGSAALTVTVPVGAKAYVVTDANWQAQHDSVGVDKSVTIRSGAPTKSF